MFLYLIIFLSWKMLETQMFLQKILQGYSIHTHPKKKNSFPHNYNIEQIYIFFFFNKYIKTQNSKFMMD